MITFDSIENNTYGYDGFLWLSGAPGLPPLAFTIYGTPGNSMTDAVVVAPPATSIPEVTFDWFDLYDAYWEQVESDQFNCDEGLTWGWETYLEADNIARFSNPDHEDQVWCHTMAAAEAIKETWPECYYEVLTYITDQNAVDNTLMWYVLVTCWMELYHLYFADKCRLQYEEPSYANSCGGSACPPLFTGTSDNFTDCIFDNVFTPPSGGPCVSSTPTSTCCSGSSFTPDPSK